MIQGSAEVISEGSPGYLSESFQRSLMHLSGLSKGLSLGHSFDIHDSSFRDPGEVAYTFKILGSILRDTSESPLSSLGVSPIDAP